MNNNSHRQEYTLALETGIGGGSISIFKDGRLVDYSATDLSVLKVDNLIEKLSLLIKKINIKKNEFEKIIYSENPGSRVGLKIGAAVAKGLSLSLNIGITGKDLFECILKIDETEGVPEKLIILPLNGEFFIWKHFNKHGICINLGQDKFSDVIKAVVTESNKNDIRIFIPLNLTVDPQFQSCVDEGIEIVDLSINLSLYLAM